MSVKKKIMGNIDLYLMGHMQRLLKLSNICHELRNCPITDRQVSSTL